MDTEFWLEGSRWFGMTMYPGYGDGPYYSPITLTGFQLIDDCIFDLDFLNLAYAQGVQEFSIEFETVRETAEYQLCLPIGQSDRTYIFEPLTARWMQAHFPQFETRGLFDAAGSPISEAILALANGRPPSRT